MTYLLWWLVPLLVFSAGSAYLIWREDGVWREIMSDSSFWVFWGVPGLNIWGAVLVIVICVAVQFED